MQTNVESKDLKLVCKCGSCTRWEIIIKTSGEVNGVFQFSTQYLVCVNCGLEVDCNFDSQPHEGLHYEKHVKGDEKLEKVSNAHTNAVVR